MKNDHTSPPIEHQQSRNPAINRERILTATRHLFATQGIEATSMNQIAHAAHVGPGTLYRHFANKSTLCEAILEENFGLFRARVLTIMGTINQPRTALACLDLVIDEILELLILHIPLLNAIQTSSPEHNHFQGPVYGWIAQQLTQILQHAVNASEIRPIDVEFTTDAILAATLPSLILFQHQQRGFSYERIAAGIRQVFIDGLRQRQDDSTAH